MLRFCGCGWLKWDDPPPLDFFFHACTTLAIFSLLCFNFCDTTRCDSEGRSRPWLPAGRARAPGGAPVDRGRSCRGGRQMYTLVLRLRCPPPALPLPKLATAAWRRPLMALLHGSFVSPQFLCLDLFYLIRAYPSGFSAVKCKQQIRRKCW